MTENIAMTEDPATSNITGATVLRQHTLQPRSTLQPRAAQVSTPATNAHDTALIAASKPYAKENRALSWYYVASTYLIWIALITAAAFIQWWPLRLAVSVVAGLVTVRMFILYHDFLHNAILHHSKPAKWLLYPYGMLVLTPPNVWRQTHNYHHAHTAKIVGSHVGSYPMVTTDMWKQMNWSMRLLYRIQRHPVTILLGYLTIFVYGMCASSFIRNPKKNWDSAAALLLHVVLNVAIWRMFGTGVWFFAFILPLMVACASGGYLFYAQHNFEGIVVQPRHEWNYTQAALHSSSYMKLGPIMRWFTGNIGYHHVHHLNPKIPFYRLPEAMGAIAALQSPHITTLSPWEVYKCFRLKLWDPEKQRMVGYRHA